jgi:hypothetical protein
VLINEWRYIETMDGTSEDGIHEIPKLSLSEALYTMRGESIYISGTTRWATADNKVKASPYSGYELLFFVVHYYKAPFSYEHLGMPELVGSEGVWTAFQKFKADARERARHIMRIHRGVLQDTSGTRPAMEILMDPTMEIGPVARVEAALELSIYPDAEPDEVLRTFGIKAGEVLMGIPEMLEFAPLLKKSLEEGDVARSLFP